MKEQIKAPGKIQLSNEEIANLSDTQFKTLVIRTLTEMVEYGHKIEEEMQSIQSETKENIQGTNSDGKETETQVNDLEQKEEINIQPEQNEETRIQKNEGRLRNLRELFYYVILFYYVMLYILLCYSSCPTFPLCPPPPGTHLPSSNPPA